MKLVTPWLALSLVLAAGCLCGCTTAKFNAALNKLPGGNVTEVKSSLNCAVYSQTFVADGVSTDPAHGTLSVASASFTATCPLFNTTDTVTGITVTATPAQLAQAVRTAPGSPPVPAKPPLFNLP